MQLIENLWAVNATVVHHTNDKDCVSCSLMRQVPTFYLLGDEQGILTEEQAIEFAKRIILPVELDYDAVQVNVSVAKL